MEVFLALVGKLLPLYALIALGWIAGTVLKVQRDSVAFLLIYILLPIVIFDGVMTVNLSAATLSLPIFFWILCSVLCFVGYGIAGLFWKDATRNLAAFAAANGNTGYFGLPVALTLFGQKALGPLVLGSMGFLLYENTVGFFILSRSHFTAKESISKIVRMPAIYALLFALLLRSASIGVPPVFQDVILNVRGAYSVLGMMMIGIALAGRSFGEVDGKLLAFTQVGKFIIWPLTVFGLLWIDGQTLHLYADPLVRSVMLLLSMVPLAANTVAFSSMLRAHPGKAAVAVLFSTLIALFVIPLLSSFVF